MRVSRQGSIFLGFGSGNAADSPRARAAQPEARGQRWQAGALRVQTVAPRSIIPWL